MDKILTTHFSKKKKKKKKNRSPKIICGSVTFSRFLTKQKDWNLGIDIFGGQKWLPTNLRIKSCLANEALDHAP
jgi:hypothetical protein